MAGDQDETPIGSRRVSEENNSLTPRAKAVAGLTSTGFYWVFLRRALAAFQGCHLVGYLRLKEPIKSLPSFLRVLI